MKSIATILIVFALSITLFSCSKNTKSQILGTWESDQASQRVGSDEELSHYNRLEVEEDSMKLGNYIYETKDGLTNKKVTESDVEMKYEWKSKTEILINSAPYDIEFSKNEMVIKNENVEIHYNKEK